MDNLTIASLFCFVVIIIIVVIIYIRSTQNRTIIMQSPTTMPPDPNQKTNYMVIYKKSDNEANIYKYPVYLPAGIYNGIDLKQKYGIDAIYGICIDNLDHLFLINNSGALMTA